MNSYVIEPLQKSEIDKVAVVLTDAFETNPAYSAVFRNKEHLRDGLLWLFRASLLINNQNQALTRVIKEKNSEIIGTFTLIPPQGVKNNISVYSKIRIGDFISRFGFNTLFRMLSLDSKNKKLLKESLGNARHYYLSMVVIKEEYRGKGIGTSALKRAIDELTGYNPDCRVLGLTTQLPENVTFYSRLGFHTLDEGYVTFRESKYYNYNMSFNLP